jgi:SulP family sulfate permease
VVILLPVVQNYGLGGLLISGLMAGVILVLMGLARLGNFIQIVPYPVTVGFTAGIAVVIAVLQIKDLFGLDILDLDGHFTDKVATIALSLPTLSWAEAATGVLTFAVLVLWKKTRSRVPSHLVALLAGSAAAFLAGALVPEFQVATVGSRFQYEIDGVAGSGIPPFLPGFAWPWELPGRDGNPIGISFELVRSLLPPAFAIAMLGALESLLSAVVADGVTGKKHNPNDELIGQGIGNIIAPLFGGIPATAALARTAANVRAGGTMPLASVVHALFILLSILVLAPLLAYIPVASMAALLLMVAWNMSETKHFVRIVRFAPRDDIMVLLTCFVLTVLFDMEVAVAVGMLLAAMLFIHRSIEQSGSRLLERVKNGHEHRALPESILVYDINGALFFGSAQKALSVLTGIRKEIEIVVLDMSDVTMLDMSAMIAMESIVESCKKRGLKLVINRLDPRLILRLRRIGLRAKKGVFEYSRDMDAAIDIALRMKEEAEAPAVSGASLPS